ncbi:LOW QUALITY PROTEIN: MerR family transcriptional regulator, partial [Streptomyces himastatinicus ATCC 53653]
RSMSIGTVLNLLRDEFPEVTISKIRFLESEGLVEPRRTPSGYRKFSEEDVERLALILRMQRDHYLLLKGVWPPLGGPGSVRSMWLLVGITGIIATCWERAGGSTRGLWLLGAPHRGPGGPGPNLLASAQGQRGGTWPTGDSNGLIVHDDGGGLRRQAVNGSPGCSPSWVASVWSHAICGS